MGQPKPARAFRRLAIYALAAALALGVTAHATAVEASPREKHSDAPDDSSATMQGHDGPSGGIWSSAEHDADAKPSLFQSWLASIYIRLISLKSEIQLILTHAWKLGQTKPDNTCS
jgi:hypothetical protein